MNIFGGKKDKAPGNDNITYSMLIALPICAQHILIKYYNNALTTGLILPQWMETVIILFCDRFYRHVLRDILRIEPVFEKYPEKKRIFQRSDCFCVSPKLELSRK